MNEDYKILSTLRYDPNLAKLEEISSNGNNSLVVKYSTVNNDFMLSPKFNGYKWNNDMIRDAGKDFHAFQKEFSQVNSDSVMEPHLTPDFTKQFKDLLVVDADYKDFFQSRFLFVPQHLSRINLTLEYFKCPREPVTLNELITLLIDTVIDEGKSLMDNLTEIKNGQNNEASKIRVLINKEGHIVTEVYPLRFSSEVPVPKTCTQSFVKTLLNGLSENPNNEWNIFKDTEPILSYTPYTTFKTTNRLHYTLARERMINMISKCNDSNLNKFKCEIVIFNENNYAMEGSITNIAIARKTENSHVQWVTPPLKSGCLCGVFRYYLLQLGYIREDDIKLDEINIGDTLLIFNGVMGCVRAIVKK